jgi:hypothetical protein
MSPPSSPKNVKVPGVILVKTDRSMVRADPSIESGIRFVYDEPVRHSLCPAKGMNVFTTDPGKEGRYPQAMAADASHMILKKKEAVS